MQCSVSSDYGTSILNSSEININEHNNITITSYYGLLFVVLLNKTVFSENNYISIHVKV